MMNVCFESTYCPSIEEITENHYQLLQREMKEALAEEDYLRCAIIKKLQEDIRTNRK